MPSRYVIRAFEKNSVYHVFNRGVEKRVIFPQRKDYSYFMRILSDYLSDSDKQTRWRRSYSGVLTIEAFCLMPNHFHLALRQLTDVPISDYMRSLINSYTWYINEKYKRVGPLFQGRFKAVKVESDEQLIHLTRYIHLNPRDIGTRTPESLINYPFSSFGVFAGRLSYDWISLKCLHDYFDGDPERYQEFVLDRKPQMYNSPF